MQNDKLETEKKDEVPSNTPPVVNNVEAGQIISPSGSVSGTVDESNALNQPTLTAASQNTPSIGGAIQPTKKRNLNKILWVIVLISATPLILILASYLFLAALAQTGASGTELMALYLIPVVLFLPLLLPIGIISAAILLFRDNKTLHRIILILLIVIYGLIIIPSAKLLLSNNQFNKKLNSVDTIELIKNCEIESFVKNDQNEVDIRYSDEINGAYNNRAHYADPNSYDEYVIAAKEMNGKCGDLRISYENYVTGESNDPDWPGDRWVTKEEAVKSILLCKVNVILTHIRPFDSVQDEPVKGVKTNIALRESSDTGMSGDLFVYSAAESVSTNEEISNAVDTASEKCGFQPYTNLVDKENIKNIKQQ